MLTLHRVCTVAFFIFGLVRFARLPSGLTFFVFFFICLYQFMISNCRCATNKKEKCETNQKEKNGALFA